MAMEKEGITVVALDRGLTLMHALGRASRPLSLSELARATGLHKATASRLLLTLVRSQFVQRTDGKFELGLGAFQIGLSYQRAHFLHLVRGTLSTLLKAGCPSPSFHVLCSPSSQICLLRLEQERGELTSNIAGAGAVLPVGKGAPGRVLLDYADGAPADRSVIGTTMSWGERLPDRAAIAAPVFGDGERLHGAVAVSGPKANFTEPVVSRVSAAILAAAAELSHKLGADPDVYSGHGQSLH